jgi:hypothetical protein
LCCRVIVHDGSEKPSFIRGVNFKQDGGPPPTLPAAAPPPPEPAPAPPPHISTGEPIKLPSPTTPRRSGSSTRSNHGMPSVFLGLHGDAQVSQSTCATATDSCCAKIRIFAQHVAQRFFFPITREVARGQFIAAINWSISGLSCILGSRDRRPHDLASRSADGHHRKPGLLRAGPASPSHSPLQFAVNIVPILTQIIDGSITEVFFYRCRWPPPAAAETSSPNSEKTWAAAFPDAYPPRIGLGPGVRTQAATSVGEPITKTTTYVAYSDEVEQQRPDEQELINSIVESFRRINELAYKRYKHGVRDQHAKSHGVLRGELTVYTDLPPHLRQGLFATPATYPVIARISTAGGEIRSDQVHLLRGMAIKVLGVNGPKVLPDDDGVAQDFLLVNEPTITFGDVHAYRKAMPLAAMLAKAPDVAVKVAGTLARVVTGVLRTVHIPPPQPVELFAVPNNHILGQTFHSMGALRYGEYIAKLSAAPLSESVRAFVDRPIDGALGDDALRKLVVDFFASNSAEYELRAQLCKDLTVMPVEDASKRWPDTGSAHQPIASPHQPIAKIIFPAQNAYSPARRAYADDALSFNPWHALADHRPLGSINRVRIKVYEASTAFRHKMNNAMRVEPRDITELPD